MNTLLIIAIILLIWGFFIEPNIIVQKKYKFKNNDLKGCKFVLFSDIHIAPWQKKRLKRIVNKINKLNPDMVLSTGDFVSGYIPSKTLPIEDIGKELANIKSKYGTFAVLGNHDWWQNGAHIREILTQNKITVLENNSKNIEINNKMVSIAGIEDLQTRIPNPQKALKKTARTTILLTHNPDPFFEIKEKVFLTLAGHNHGGQVQLPFFGALIVPAKSGCKYANGRFTHNNNTLIVTKGLGNSILNVRFCCPPEIVLLEFE